MSGVGRWSEQLKVSICLILCEFNLYQQRKEFIGCHRIHERAANANGKSSRRKFQYDVSAEVTKQVRQLFPHVQGPPTNQHSLSRFHNESWQPKPDFFWLDSDLYWEIFCTQLHMCGTFLKTAKSHLKMGSIWKPGSAKAQLLSHRVRTGFSLFSLIRGCHHNLPSRRSK